MNSLASKMKIMNLLGTGKSVQTLLDIMNITFDQLCELAAEYPDLHTELKRWYKRYDFTVKPSNSLETKEETEKPAKNTRKKVVAK